MFTTREVAKMCHNTLGTYRNYWIPKLKKAGIVPEKKGNMYFFSAEQVTEIRKMKGIEK